MAEIAWFENALGQLLPRHGASRPVQPAATDTARFRRHRTIFISDTHLGTRGCKAEALADFLAHNDCDTLFLVGDIVDGWQTEAPLVLDATHRPRWSAKSCARWMTARA